MENRDWDCGDFDSEGEVREDELVDVCVADSDETFVGLAVISSVFLVCFKSRGAKMPFHDGQTDIGENRDGLD